MKGDFNTTVVLIKTVETSDNGILTVAELRREVFAELISSSSVKKEQASTVGTGLEIKLQIPDISEYEGERFAEFEGNVYEITKTFRVGDMIELTCIRGVR